MMKTRSYLFFIVFSSFYGSESLDNVVGEDQGGNQTDGAENALKVFFGACGHSIRSFQLREQGLLW